MIHKLLFVDDEPLILRVIDRLFGGEYDLATADGGKAGLEKLINLGPYSVVFTDMRMPQMSGIEFLKQAREISPETTYIMLTGNQDQETATLAAQCQVFRYLNKPCQPDQIRIAIDDAIRHFESISEQAEPKDVEPKAVG
ncbi:MAG: response regulator [Planctomycetota bacterium]